MLDLSKIYEGWRNNLIPPAHLKTLIDTTYQERMAICLQCPHHSDNAKKNGYTSVRPDAHCTNCGCTLAAKTKCLSCECPLQKWTAVVKTQEEEQKLKNDLK
jgi:hypothetical protein